MKLQVQVPLEKKSFRTKARSCCNKIPSQKLSFFIKNFIDCLISVFSSVRITGPKVEFKFQFQSRILKNYQTENLLHKEFYSAPSLYSYSRGGFIFRQLNRSVMSTKTNIQRTNQTQDKS